MDRAVTCICTDGKTMAADGLTTEQGVIVRRRDVKVERLSDGRLFGAAGDCASGQRIRKWLENGQKPFPKINLEVRALVLNLDGTADLYDEECGGEPVRMELPMAIGSGAGIAIGAMEAGATPSQAVKIAKRRVPSVGGKITEVRL